MATWQGRSRGNKSGYGIFVWVLKNFGVFPAYFLLRFVSFYFFLFSYTASRNTLHLYRKKLRYSWLRSIGMLYSNYYQFGMSLIDKVVVMSGMKNRFTFDFDGEEHLRKMVKDGNGGLLLSAHVGNWEIAGHLLKRLGTTINIVMYDGEEKQIKQYLSSVTGARAVNVIVIKNDISHIYQISEALARKELVCMHADRFVEGNKTRLVDFLGAPARFPVGPFVLAGTFKVPVSFVFAMKESSLHYHFFATADQTDATLSKSQLADKLSVGFAKEMENKLKQYPQQWYNFYNFWQ